MKKYFFAFMAGGFALLLVFAFKPANLMQYLPTNATCEAAKVGGFYIYVDAVPVKKYRLIGVITSDELGIRLKDSQQYSSMKYRFVGKAVEQYGGQGDGLIFNLCDGCVDKVNVVKFD